MSDPLQNKWAQVLRQFGRRRAVVEAARGASASFAQLEAGARRWLAAQEIGGIEWRGRVVAYGSSNGIGWFEVFLGLLHAGAVAVPIDPSEPRESQQQIARELRAAAWWDGNTLHRLPDARRLTGEGVRLLKLTSGTTARPRALAFTSSQLLADGRQVTSTMGIGATDLNYASIPLGHSYGLGNLVIPLVAHGVPLIVSSASLPHAIAEDFRKWKPTVFPSVPSLWRALAASELPATAFRSLRFGISAGSPLSPEIARDFLRRYGHRLHAFYGSSETGGIAFDRTGNATLEGGVGTAMKGVRIEVAPGGRIHVSSAAVFTTGNRRRDARGGRWTPPDRVLVDARGQLRLLGRRGRLVKVAGRRVNLEAIKDRLSRLPGVEEVWVGTSTRETEMVIGAALVSSRSVSELRSLLQVDTPAWRIPRRMIVLPALPLTSRGKTDSSALTSLVFR